MGVFVPHRHSADNCFPVSSVHPRDFSNDERYQKSGKQRKAYECVEMAALHD